MISAIEGPPGTARPSVLPPALQTEVKHCKQLHLFKQLHFSNSCIVQTVGILRRRAEAAPRRDEGRK